MSRRVTSQLRRSGLAGAVLLLAAAAPLSAQDLYIVGGTVDPVVAPQSVTTVVIRDGTILALDPAATPGPDDDVIDATGMTVTPGLVDFDTTLGLVEIWAVPETRDLDAGGDEVRAAFRVIDALNPQSVLVPTTRVEGVTSVVSHPHGGLISGQSAWWDLGGDRADQMVVLAPATIDMGGGAAEANATGGSRGSTMLRYRELFSDVDSALADTNAYEARRMRELSVSRIDIEALAPVLSGELPVFFHADRQADILAAIRLADEYGLRLIIDGGAEAWALADLLAERQIPVVLNPLINAPYTFEELGAREDAAAILDRAGVPVILTTEEAHRVRTLRQYAGNAVRAGMDHQSALRAVTLRPAQAVGLDDRYGSIEPGKVANLVVWTGDPFELATRVRDVIIGGQRVPLSSRQTRLLDRYRHLE